MLYNYFCSFLCRFPIEFSYRFLYTIHKCVVLYTILDHSNFFSHERVCDILCLVLSIFLLCPNSSFYTIN